MAQIQRPFRRRLKIIASETNFPKIQIEHVANTEKYRTCNRNKLLKKWYEKPKAKEQKAIQKLH